MINPEQWKILYENRLNCRGQCRRISKEIEEQTGKYIAPHTIHNFYKRWGFENLPPVKPKQKHTPPAVPTTISRTLCWRCANAVPRPQSGLGCSWSVAFVPVEGWVATKTPERKAGDNIVKESYTVKECPMFKEEISEQEERIRLLSKKYFV